MFKYFDSDTFNMDCPKLKDWTTDKKQNPYVTETAGFVPLDVQIQKFEQAGIRAKFRSDMFDSSDYRDMYLHPDTLITDEDDEIDIENKLELQNYIRSRIFYDKQNKGRESFEKMRSDFDEMKRSEAERYRGEAAAHSSKPPAAGAAGGNQEASE